MANEKLVTLGNLSEFKTKNDAIYVPKTRTIAGVNLQNDISSSSLNKSLGTIISLKNLVENGNFNDTTGWGGSNATISALNNTLDILSSASNGYAYYTISTSGIVGHIYATVLKIKSSTNQIRIRAYDMQGGDGDTYPQGNGTFEQIVKIGTCTGTSLYLFFTDTRSNNFDDFYLKEVMTFDLTADFGVGNEPSAEKLLKIINNEYIDGEKNICSVYNNYEKINQNSNEIIKKIDNVYLKNIFNDTNFEYVSTSSYSAANCSLTSTDGVLKIKNDTVTSYSFGYTVARNLASKINNIFGKYYFGFWFKMPSHKSDIAQFQVRLCFYSSSALANVNIMYNLPQAAIKENEWIYVNGIYDASGLNYQNIEAVMMSFNVTGMTNQYTETWEVQIKQPVFVNLTNNLGSLDTELNEYQIKTLLQRKVGNTMFFNGECYLIDITELYNLGYGKIQSRLYKKKIAFCGDSITEGTDPNGGYFYRWCEQIRDRNKMQAVINAISGSTMAETAYNPFVGTSAQRSAGTARYQSLGDNLDFIVIWFGWNDVSYSSLGTNDSTDSTTFYGAYNIVLSYLVDKYPNAKILLVSPYLGSVTETGNNFQEAVKNMAIKYGCCLYDFRDIDSPVISNKPNVDGSIVTIYKTNRTYDNTHPNQNGHNIISWEIESALKGK